MREFSAINAKTYSNLIDNKGENKKRKGRKNCVIERKL